jgi:hypothetical protein
MSDVTFMGSLLYRYRGGARIYPPLEVGAIVWLDASRPSTLGGYVGQFRTTYEHGTSGIYGPTGVRVDEGSWIPLEFFENIPAERFNNWQRR